MALNAFTGWGISTALLWLFNKRENSSTSTEESSSLSVTDTATKIGKPIPVVLGRCMVKEPLVAYFGDFSAKPYTEEYSAHSQFDGKSLVLSLILALIAAAVSGHQVTPGQVTTKGANEGGELIGTGESVGATYKDDLTGPLLMSLFTWLLGWLINGRNLKTTIQKGFKYYLGYQFLICWSGDGVGLRKIWMNTYDTNTEASSQNAIWSSGTASLANNPTGITVSINDENMFGGPDESGGFVGNVNIYFGGTAQGKDAWMIKEMSRDSVQAELRGLTPKYSKYVTAVIPTAYIGKQSSIPSMWFEMVNYPKNLGFDLIGNDLNPAEALYEIITNKSWGCKETADRIDVDSLLALGTTCKNEELGISLQISSTVAAKEIVNNILNHINAVKYDNPLTGKLTFKLIRNDYVETELKILSPDNCESSTFNRLDWSETVADITVSYTDPDNLYETSTIPYRDLANPLITGNRTEKKIEGTYFTTASNALSYAQRESLAQGYPLASVELVTNREASSMTIGEPFIYKWPQNGINKMIMRIVDIDYGSLTDGRIKIEALEDVFGFGKSEYSFSNGIEWNKPEVLPQEVVYSRFFELPYEMTHVLDTYVNAVAAQPSVYTVYWTVWRLLGSSFKATAKSSIWTATARMVYGYSDNTEYEDALGFQIREVGTANLLDEMKNTIDADTNDIYNNRSGTNLLIVDDEIMSFDYIEKLPNGDFNVKGVIRGVYDTTVGIHTTESVVYFLWNTLNVNGTSRLLKKGETSSESFNITSSTVDRETDFDNEKIVSLQTTRRSEQPSIMGDVQVASDMGSSTYFRRKFDAATGGDILIKFTQRDKFSVSGVISQTETSFRGQDIEASDTMVNVLVAKCNGQTVEHVSPAKGITQIKYTWADYCNDFDRPTDPNVSFELFTRDTVTGLNSWAKHHINTVAYDIPVNVGIVDLDHLESYADSIVSAGGVLIPKSDYIPQTLIPYNLCPIVLIGQQTSTGIIGQDGNKYTIQGTTAYRITGTVNNKAILMPIEVTNGYTLKSGFNVDYGNYSFYYKYDNGQYREVNYN